MVDKACLDKAKDVINEVQLTNRGKLISSDTAYSINACVKAVSTPSTGDTSPPKQR